MNKKVIFIIMLAIIALIVLTLFSFGPLTGKRKNVKINPVSQKPQNSEPVTINNQPVRFNTYSNKDVKENYYSVKLPQDWRVQSGQKSGSYNFTFPDGIGDVELMDVPDNTTLELFILSQQEPLLKKSLNNYVRKDYKKLKVNGNEAYELIFDNTDNRQFISTVKTYITGKDNAAVITLNVKQDKFIRLLPISSSILSNFKWENK